MEMEFRPSLDGNSKAIEEEEEEGEGEALETVIIDNQEDSDISDMESTVFKWLSKIHTVDLRIRCDVFLEPPKVQLDITLSSGRHLCLDNLRQCSDDAIEDLHKSKTIMVRTYKGKDYLKIRCSHDSKSFFVMEPQSEKPVSVLTVTHSKMEVHNLLQDEWYFVDLSNRRSKLLLIRSCEDGSELGRVLGFGDFEPQSSSSGNVMILKPKLKFIVSDVEEGQIGLDNVQKAILLSIFIALGLTFDCDVRKTTDAFNLLVTSLIIISIICSVVIYRNSETLKAHGNLLYLISGIVLLVLLGLLYLIRCCLR